MRTKIEQEGEPKNYKRKRKGRHKQKTTRNSAWPLSKDRSEVMKMSWRRWSLDGRRKNSKTGE